MQKLMEIISKLSGRKTYLWNLAGILGSLLVLSGIIPAEALPDLKELIKQGYALGAHAIADITALLVIYQSISNIFHRKAVTTQTNNVIAAVNDHTTLVTEVQTERIQTPGLKVTDPMFFRPE